MEVYVVVGKMNVLKAVRCAGVGNTYEMAEAIAEKADLNEYRIDKFDVQEMEKLTTKQRFDQHKPIEVWVSFDQSWKWEVYRKYQKPEKEIENPYARWFCKVYSPIVPDGEIGDVYISEIKSSAIRTK